MTRGDERVIKTWHGSLTDYILILSTYLPIMPMPDEAVRS